MMDDTRFRYLAAISLLVLVGFVVRAVSLDAQSLWRDEVDALRFATAPWSEMVDNFTRPGWNGPLYYALLRGWIALAGTSEYAMRFFSLLFGVLCIPLIYQLGRRLFRPPGGIISGLLVATSPYLVWYSQEVKMYTLVLALALLAIYSLRRALKGGGWRWWLAQIAATSLAFYSHILAALLVPVQVLLFFAWWPQGRKRWRGALISLGCLTLPYLPLAAWQAPLALKARDTGFHPYPLRKMVAILLNGWSTGITGWGKPWVGALMGLLAAGGLISSMAFLVPSADPEEEPARTAALGNYLAMLIWMVVPLLCVWLISLRQPLFTDRYLIWSIPPFYLLVALALTFFATTEQRAHWIVVLLLGVILVFNGVNLQRQAAKPIKSDFRGAAAYVASYEEGPTADQPPPSGRESRYSVYLPITSVGAASPDFEDLIIFQIPHGRYTFDYYFPIETYPRAEGLYTNHQAPNGEYLMSEKQAARQMREMTEPYDTVWLVATEVPMWDKRELVKHWLDEHARRVTREQFHRVDVYRYELPDT
jgi:4-amino-4-deoxy-L-arabinose transferase-like glycosyltransferase